MFNDCLPKTENFVLSQFVRSGTNGPMGGNCFSYYSPAGALPR